MESERRALDIGPSAVIAGQAHRRIDLLLDKVKELTEERDEAVRDKDALAISGHEMRKAWDAHECSEDGTLRRALKEVAAERDRWRDQANDDAAKYIDAAERAARSGPSEFDSECFTPEEYNAISRQLDESQAIVIDQARHIGKLQEERGNMRAERDIARANEGDAIERAEQFERERDEAREMYAGLRERYAADMRRHADRHEALRADYSTDAALATETMERLAAERDELRRRLEHGHVCTSACAPNAHVAFVGREELDRVTAERDQANAMVANLRGVLSSIVECIERQEPKSCNCGAVSLLPRHIDPNCPFHGKDSES